MEQLDEPEEKQRGVPITSPKQVETSTGPVDSQLGTNTQFPAGRQRVTLDGVVVTKEASGRPESVDRPPMP